MSALKILQVIGSLDVGGAERMAVNYANALVSRVAESGLVATRGEGLLKSEIAPKVDYFFLSKKSALDPKAILKLRAICKARKINVLHAHGDAFFMAVLVKLLYPQIKIVWHDHYGLSEFLQERGTIFLKPASRLFHGIIAVNAQLKKWAETALHCNRVIYLPNFANQTAGGSCETELVGKSGAKVLCLANLRPQKNHHFLIEVARRMVTKHPECTFHLVGQDFGDDYSRGIRERILSEGLERNIVVYGSRMDIQHIIQQCDIAILTSKSEGLPVSLLEYGMQAKSVVMTAVGEIPNILRDGENGFLVESEDLEGFITRLELLTSDSALRARLGDALKKTVLDHYSENAILRVYLGWLAEEVPHGGRKYRTARPAA